MIQKLYPQGKRRAFTVTYDDGVLQDVRFVALLNRYGLKGTFNLNSRLMEERFTWQHACGMLITRLSPQQAVPLYAGHEVASHSLTHPYMEHLSEEQIMAELQTDKANLEALFDREIKGFAVPFDHYSSRIERCARRCGFTYVRIPEEWHSFAPPADLYNWKAGIFHLRDDLEERVTAFLHTEQELALCQIVGHSYDLDVENQWQSMEQLFQMVSSGQDIAFMTTIELVEYLAAMEKVQITKHGIANNSDRSLWFAIDGQPCEVNASSP